jgi:DNA invertase Pin-like site-specific DNA recombinase
MSKRAVVYVRVSTRGQETLGDQARRCRQFAESQNWEVVDVLEDKASAWSGKDRPGWLQVEGMVERREVDAVVVFQVSRAARNVGRLHAFITLCRDNRVTFATASDGVNTSTPTGRLLATIVGALAELDSDIKSELTRLGLDAVRADGWYTGGRPPFGFDLVQETPEGRRKSARLVEDGEESELVREAATRFLAGEAMGTVAADWNRRGIGTPRAGERLKHTGRWSGHTIRDVLRNPAHQGRTLTHRDYDRIQEALDGQVRATVPRGDRYMLTGVLRCGVCGEAMVGQPRRGVRRYICNRGPHDTVIRADDVEAIVTRRAAGARRSVEGVADPRDASRDLLGKLGEAEDELRRAAREAGEQGIDPGTLRAYLAPLTEKRDRLRAELDESATAPAWTFSGLLEDPGEPTTIEWRAMIEELVESVEIGPRKVGDVRAPSTAHRVVIRWRDGVQESA